MIRLFLYAIFRIIIIGLAVYFGLAILRWIVRSLQGQPVQSFKKGDPEKSETHEEYKDVQDAKYEELEKKEDREKEGK